MDIFAESGVGKLNNFACSIFWLMLSSYMYLAICRLFIGLLTNTFFLVSYL